HCPGAGKRQRNRDKDEHLAFRKASQEEVKRQRYEVKDRDRPNQDQHSTEESNDNWTRALQREDENDVQQSSEDSFRQHFVRVMNRRYVQRKEQRCDQRRAAVASVENEEVNANCEAGVDEMLENDDRQRPRAKKREEQRIAGRPERLDLA